MKPEALANYKCKCGENPLWNPREKRIYWTDIETGRMFRQDAKTLAHEQFYTGSRVGGFTFQADGNMLAFRDKGNIAILNIKDASVVKTIIDAIPGEEEGRFNDVIADPEGRVYCGTLTDTGKPGRLFRLDTNGKITKLLDGIGCANGMGFTPDLKRMYFTDSGAFKIYIFDYDRKTGALTNQRTFVEGKKEDGFPDGMTVDADGDVWSTRWDGHCIIHYGPDGKEKGRVKFPTKKVSSCVFGGEDYKDVYVTTAGGEDTKQNGDAAGTLYRFKPGVKGVPEFLSRVGI